MLDCTQDAQDWYGLSLLDVPEVAEAHSTCKNVGAL